MHRISVLTVTLLLLLAAPLASAQGPAPQVAEPGFDLLGYAICLAEGGSGSACLCAAGGPCPEAATEAGLPCLRPVDLKCIVNEVGDEADAALVYAAALVQWGRDVVDWLECSLTSSHFCGVMPQAPLPPYVDLAAPTSLATAARIDIGPCAWVDPGTSGGWDIGSVPCYRSWASTTVQAWEDWEDAMTDWVDEWIEYVECGMHLECTPPGSMPSPPISSVLPGITETD